MRIGIILLLLSSSFAQVTIKGSVALKGSVKVMGTSGGGGGGIPAGIGWHALAGTNQSAACPSTSNAATSCTTGGDFSYSGCVGDTTRSRLGCPLVGGHADSSDPNTYVFDCSGVSCSWSDLTNYTGYTARDCSNVADGIIHSISSYPPAGAPGTCATPQNAGTIPASRHTYQNCGYSPTQDAYYCFPAVALAWSAPGSDATIWKLPANSSTWSLISSSSSIGGVPPELAVSWDTADNKFKIFDYTYLWSFDPATNTETKLNPSAPYSVNINVASAIDATKHYMVLVGHTISGDQMFYIKLDGSDSYALHDVSSTASANGCQPLMAVTIPGFTWDSVGGNLVGWPGNSANGNTIYVLDTSTFHCSTEALTGADTVTSFTDSTNACGSAQPCSGSSHRFEFMPNIDAFEACPAATMQCYGMRRR